jgi:glycogen debranching enzyme
MDDSYSVQTTAVETSEAGGLDTLQALKDGDTFLVADGWGDLKGGADGLFDSDTRLLSRFQMTAGMARPSRLSSGVSRDNVFFTAHSTNRPLPPMGGRSAPAGVLHIERRRFLWNRRMFERVRMVNHGVEDVLLPLAFDFAADFADIFQVRGTLREKRGTVHTPTHDGRRVTFKYTGLDDVERTSCLAFSEPPARLSATRPSSCSACRWASGWTSISSAAARPAPRPTRCGGARAPWRRGWRCGAGVGAAPRCAARAARCSTPGWTSRAPTWRC